MIRADEKILTVTWIIQDKHNWWKVSFITLSELMNAKKLVDWNWRVALPTNTSVVRFLSKVQIEISFKWTHKFAINATTFKELLVALADMVEQTISSKKLHRITSMTSTLDRMLLLCMNFPPGSRYLIAKKYILYTKENIYNLHIGKGSVTTIEGTRYGHQVVCTLHVLKKQSFSAEQLIASAVRALDFIHRLSRCCTTNRV